MAFPARLLLAFCGASLALANPLQHSASTFAGATSTAVFPPPNATNTAVDTFFPDAAEVGHAGPTPSTFDA